MSTDRKKPEKRRGAPLVTSKVTGTCFIYNGFAPMACPLCGVTVPAKTEHRCERKEA